MDKKIAVIFGGQSNENEISVITGTMALNVLKSAGYETVPVYIAQNGDIYTGGKACGYIQLFIVGLRELSAGYVFYRRGIRVK